MEDVNQAEGVLTQAVHALENAVENILHPSTPEPAGEAEPAGAHSIEHRSFGRESAEVAMPVTTIKGA